MLNQRVLTGVDVFLNSQATFFNRFHVDADVPPRGERSLVSGDFDGDLIDDFAFLSDALEDQGGSVWAGFGSADGQFAESDLTFAEMDPAEKHRISHRADAFAKLVAALL